MLHPSYSDLMEVVNSDVTEGEQPVVQSRYSIVLATAKRARQIVSGEKPLVGGKGKKPLSIAVEELYKGKIKILSEEEAANLENQKQEPAGEAQDTVIEESEAETETNVEESESAAEETETEIEEQETEPEE